MEQKKEERRKGPDRRTGLYDGLFKEWAAKSLLRDRRKGDRRKTAPTAPPDPLHIEEIPTYQQYMKKVFHKDVRSSIIQNATKNIHEYIDSLNTIKGRAAASEASQCPFITISRQAGTGGHLLAQAILQAMEKNGEDRLLQGWQMLDQEIGQSVMDDPRLNVSLDTVMTEKFSTEFDDYLGQIFSGTSSQLAVYHKIFRIISTFALMGKVIIVGRAGSLLTRELPLGIHVRLVADKKSRIRNIMNQFSGSVEEAERMIDEKDASRARLVKSCFNRDIEDPLLYDAVWNTDRTPLPGIAEAIVHRVRKQHT